MYSYQEIEFAMCGIRILLLIILVSFASYFAKSRLMFLLGCAGCFLGLVVPMTQRTSQTFESSLHWTASHIFGWGLIGGIIGCCVALVITNQTQKQFSIRTLLITTAAVALFVVLAKMFWFD